MPSERVVREHLNNFETLQACPAVSAIIKKALVAFGRDNFSTSLTTFPF